MSVKQRAFALIHIILCICYANLASGQQMSLLQPGLFSSAGQPLFNVQRANFETGGGRSVASLFMGREGGSLFAPYPKRQRQPARLLLPARAASQIERVRALIGQAESGAKSYDAVQHGAAILPAKPPTQMTLQEIYDWIIATPGQQHAIGHYQFIPTTLKRLVTQVGIDLNQVFDQRVQDRLGDALLIEAGMNAFRRGTMERHTLMNNMAKIWAGLPNSTGLSHYHGIAGNRATITWAFFDQEMANIFPS